MLLVMGGIASRGSTRGIQEQLDFHGAIEETETILEGGEMVGSRSERRSKRGGDVCDGRAEK